MMNTTFVISNELRNALLQYFSNRPWSEAEQFMHLLWGLKELNNEGYTEYKDS